MYDELESMLTFTVERETDEGNKNYIARDCRTYYKDKSGGSKPLFDRGSIQEFRKIGSKVAIVQRYKEGMIDELGVDAVIEIDGGPPLNEPFVFEQTTRNMHGMTIRGMEDLSAKIANEVSMESIMFVSGTPFIGPAKAGFIPHEADYFSLGKTLDGKDVRVKVQDMRPKPPMGVPSVSPVSRL